MAKQYKSIGGSVGIANGKQCYNAPQDQNAVIDLLDQIPNSKGGTGTEQGAWEQPRWGFCAPGLYQAILNFQRSNCSRGLAVDGHIDPNGSAIRVLNELAGHSVPARNDDNSGLDDILAALDAFRELAAHPTMTSTGELLNCRMQILAELAALDQILAGSGTSSAPSGDASARSRRRRHGRSHRGGGPTDNLVGVIVIGGVAITAVELIVVALVVITVVVLAVPAIRNEINIRLHRLLNLGLIVISRCI